MKPQIRVNFVKVKDKWKRILEMFENGKWVELSSISWHSLGLLIGEDNIITTKGLNKHSH